MLASPLSLNAQEPDQTGKPDTYLASALTLYRGTLTSDTLTDIAVLDASYDSEYQFVTLALSHELSRLYQHLSLEAEGQITKHIAGQDHYEVNGLLGLRWSRFPWHRTLTTTAAVGAGLSYATQLPEFELKNNNGNSEKLLGYLMFELTLGLPSLPRWAIVSRVHHRSGAYGLFENGVRGASNALAIGVQRRF